MGMARFQQAEHDFSILAARPESSFLPHHALGDCYRAQGHPERALDSYLKALELLKGGETTLLREVRLKVGACLYQLERWEDAIRVL
jgi:tetratricopeptide (TPR) repeat protein